MVCALGTALDATAFAQEREVFIKPARSTYLNETNMHTPELRVRFPNINKIPYYTNKKLLRKIIQADGQGDLQRLDTLLTQYVSNFGIENFKQHLDLEYVWRLAEVKELLRDTTLALFYYGLALKNQSRHDPKIKLHFDQLRAARSSEFVDIEYYYQLLRIRSRVDTLKPPQGVRIDMGVVINTESPEYAPFMHPREKVLIFTSRRNDDIPNPNMDFMTNEDLFFTEEDRVHGGWTPVKPFPASINTIYSEGSACLSLTGDTLYFARCRAPSGMGDCDLYRAIYHPGRHDWVQVVNLGPNVNSEAWDSHPALSPDGKSLYFASNRAGGFGRTDLYVSHLDENGNWQKAQNLGPIINSIEDEVSPFMHPINNTLYFSSTGHIRNYGGFDIFKTRKIKDNWEEPSNVGPFINSKRDEYYFSINAAADTLFYSANVEGNRRNMDLFSFPMPMGARPDAVYPLTGYLVDSVTNRPLTGIVVAIDLDKRVEIEPKHIGRDGYFEFNLLNNRRYQLYVLTENAIRVSEKAAFTEEALVNFFEESAENEQPLIFESMEFMPNSAELTDDIKYHLDQIAAYLIQQPGIKLHIGGHTDSDGDPNYNLKLSQERAENIREYLLDRAELHDTVISAKGYGATMPVFPNDSKQNKARNRRVEFELILPATELARIRAKFRDDTLTLDYALRAGALDPDADDKDDKPAFKDETETSSEIAKDAEKSAEDRDADDDEQSADAADAAEDADEVQKRVLAEEEAKKAAEEAEQLKKLKEELEDEAAREAEEAERRAKEAEEADDDDLDQVANAEEAEEAERAKAEALEESLREQAERLRAEEDDDEEEEKANAKEEEAKRKREEAERLKAEAEAQKHAAEEAKRKQKEEEARQKAEAEARKKAEEEARKKAEEEAKRKAEEEARRRAYEEEQAKVKAAEEAKKRAEEEEALRKAAEEYERRQQEEARKKAEEEAKRKAEEEARRKAEEEARRRAYEEEQARKKAEEEAKRKAEEEARRKAEEERRKAEEARRKAYEEELAKKRAAEEERRRKAEEAARKAEEEREAREFEDDLDELDDLLDGTDFFIPKTQPDDDGPAPTVDDSDLDDDSGGDGPEPDDDDDGPELKTREEIEFEKDLDPKD